MKLKNTLFIAFFIIGAFMSASAQEYWIEGFYERHGINDYTLNDVNTNGIKIDGKTRLTETLRGNKMHIKCDGIDATLVQFAFQNADLRCDNPDITFQYWSEDINDWKTDVEACKYESTGFSQKDMVMMLVLDYSNSMSKNIKRMQDMAYNFVRNAANYSNGNIHIGIIAFSGMDITDHQILEITPLRKDNLSKFERFIKIDSKPGMETALYYSFDKAMNMIERYVDMHNFNEEDYNGSCMITFTDGLDNASINDQISSRMQRGSKNEYLAYLSDRVQEGTQQKKVLGLPVESYAVGFTGSEEFTDDDLTLFRLVLQKLTTDKNHFILSDDFFKVEKFFGYIFEQLTNRWKTLNLYIGEAQYGRVRWVLNCGEAPRYEPPLPDPPVRRSPWFGISAEVGALRLDDYDIEYAKAFGGVNLDMAFSINNTFAVGGRLGLMFGERWYGYEHCMGILVGPEVKITFPNNSAVIAGLGGGSVCGDGVFFLRAGYKTRKSFFLTTELLTEGDDVGFGVGLGFSFGGKNRK